jgi:hypothetical protein
MFALPLNWQNLSPNRQRKMPKGAEGVRRLAVLNADAILIEHTAIGEIEGRQSALPRGASALAE